MNPKKCKNLCEKIMHDTCMNVNVRRLRQFKNDVVLCLQMLHSCNAIKIFSRVPSKEYLKMREKLFRIQVLYETISEIRREFAVFGTCHVCISKVNVRYNKIMKILNHLIVRQREIVHGILNQFDMYVNSL